MRRTNCVNVFSTDYHKTLNTLLLTPFYFLFLFFLCTNDFMYLCAKERKIKNISMILFFRTPSKSVMAVECDHALTQAESDKLCWLFGEATPESERTFRWWAPRNDYCLEYKCCGNHPEYGLERYLTHRRVFPRKGRKR